ncbi:MAG TPA: SusC/RagA family TonB-linked outer membrane protein [Gemmatimonadales bacterium]|nr:SusC/RagA family TonB-linked outer membrane protein [Gemmatimonadales bacterium]
MSLRSKLRALGVVLALSAMTVVEAAAQGNGTIAGRVTEEAGGTGIAGARISVLGANFSATTNSEGRYSITDVGAGTYQVRVAAIGFGSLVKTVNVTAGGVTEVNFALKKVVISLDQIVVTATGESRAREEANAVSRIDASKITETKPITTIGDLLNSRAAGVTVIPSAGEVGTGERIRIRGLSSISLNNSPIVYVDGIRVDNGASLTIGTGGQTISRLNDLNPDDIASVDIVKGPSASSLYGTQAANGVIRITTKRGISGPPQWQVYTEFGALKDNNNYPTNYYGWSNAATPTSPRQCRLTSMAAGSCTIDSTTSFNPMMNPATSPLGTGYRENVGAAVSGGSQQATYRLSAGFTKDMGVLKMPASEVTRITTERGSTPPGNQLRPNEDQSVSLRSNVKVALSPKLNVAFDAGLIRGFTALPQNDNNVLGLLGSALFGKGWTTQPNTPPPGSAEGGQWGFFRPGEVFALTDRQDITRFTGSTHIDWKPWDFLTGNFTAGLDYTGQRDIQQQTRGQGPNFITYRQGRRQDNRFEISHYTVDGNLVATRQLTSRITSKTTIGAQYLKDYSFGNYAFGQILAPGSQSIGSAAQPSVNEATSETITLGAYGEEEIGLNDRLYIAGSVRRDQNSAFGSKSRTTWYPGARASWVISEEPFFPKLPIDNLRLRIAYGASGRQPGSTDALLYYGANTASITGSDQPGLVISALGNPNLKPERSTELETGFDLGFAGNAANLSFTYYHKKTTDALVSVPVPPSVGAASSKFENIGSVLNKGLEIELNVATNATKAVSANFDLAFSRNTNKLLTLGAGIPPIVSGVFQQRPGYPLYGYWDRPITGYQDANGDGIITANEVTVGDTAVFLGSSIPKTEITGNIGFGFFHGAVQLSGQLDYRGDYKVENLTDYFRCASGAAYNCQAVNDPKAPLKAQANAVAASTGADGYTYAGYIENGNFLKLRELSLTYNAPDSWANFIFHASKLSIVLTGRNLLTVTNYTGIDPELNGNGQSDFTRDFLTAPPLTYYLVRVNLSY